MQGGGIALFNSSLVLDTCNVTGNTATAGGAVYAANSPLLQLLGSRLHDNSALLAGAVAAYSSNVSVRGCSFDGNQAGFQVGGTAAATSVMVACTRCQPGRRRHASIIIHWLERCLTGTGCPLLSCMATLMRLPVHLGHAAAAHHAVMQQMLTTHLPPPAAGFRRPQTLQFCQLKEAGLGGSLVAHSCPTTSITNTSFTNNTAAVSGGAVLAYDSYLHMAGCTLAANTAVL